MEKEKKKGGGGEQGWAELTGRQVHLPYLLISKYPSTFIYDICKKTRFWNTKKKPT